MIELKSNYGSTTAPAGASSASASPSTLYCLHGQPEVKLVGHCHRQRSEGVDVKARRKLIIASILCLFFMVAEIVGGILSNSLAIATDAAHLLTDFASFMISLFAIWIAGRPSTQRMSFGWYRAEVIGAVVSVVMIWVITAILIWLAVLRIINKSYEVDAKIMLITSGLAILVNLIIGFQLHHHHGHSHSAKQPTEGVGKQNADETLKNNSQIVLAAPNATNQETHSSATTPTSSRHRIEKETGGINIAEHGQLYQSMSDDAGLVNVVSNSGGQTGQNQQHQQQHNFAAPESSSVAVRENINVRAAFIHVLGDVLQSVGVFIAALVIYFKPDWAIADPICTFVFSVIVLFTTFTIMKDALLVLMEGTPNYLHYAEVMNVFLQIEGVERVHNLRIWALSINKVALSAHLAVKPGANPKKILQDATSAVHIKYNFFETTIQIEEYSAEMEDCKQCSQPGS